MCVRPITCGEKLGDYVSQLRGVWGAIRFRRKSLQEPSFGLVLQSGDPRERTGGIEECAQVVGAYLLMASIPFYIACGALHVCMAGHMQHPPYAWWQFGNDYVWSIGLPVGVFLCWFSGCRRSTRIAVASIGLWISRLVLGSGGGSLFLFELPIIGLVVHAARATVRDARPSLWSHSANPPQPQGESPQDGANRENMIT